MSAKLTTWANQTPATHTHLVSDGVRKLTLGNIPNDRSGEVHLVVRTSQEIGLCRRAYIIDIGKYPLLDSYLDERHKNRCSQLRYLEPLSHNALNLEAQHAPQNVARGGTLM